MTYNVLSGTLSLYTTTTTTTTDGGWVDVGVQCSAADDLS